MSGPARIEKAAAAAAALALWLAALASALALRAPAGTLCAQDRVPIRPGLEVTIDLGDGRAAVLCNVTCAVLFLREQPAPPRAVTVRDEESGLPLDSESAFYAESEVFTHRESGNRVHVFASAADAEAHRANYGGRVLPSPFAPFRK